MPRRSDSLVALTLALSLSGCADNSERDRFEGLCAALDDLIQEIKVEADHKRIDDVRLDYCAP
jgi:uncharacterized lipoprotein YehR (DUF1307 family)